ncbi:MAG TPA: ImmA/IrrE family metallo-endopeptidase [Armatimonadetes bacterium]|nr:ImmA/IrrE family metallo-endopeptidase [Armatimonadota bacterium]
MRKKDPVQAVRAFALDLVRQADFEEPPICPYSIAARNGLLVREEYLVNSNTAYAMRVETLSSWLVTLHSGNLPEERCWQLARKIIEILFPRKEGERLAEQVITAGAAELLLPTDWFDPLCRHYKYDLLVLKQKFGNVSYELLGRRVLLLTPAVLTVVENAQLTLRLGSEGLHFPPWPTTQELDAIWTAHDKGRPVVSDGRHYCVRAWPVRRSATDRVVALSFPK